MQVPTVCLSKTDFLWKDGRAWRTVQLDWLHITLILHSLISLLPSPRESLEFLSYIRCSARHWGNSDGKMSSLLWRSLKPLFWKFLIRITWAHVKMTDSHMLLPSKTYWLRPCGSKAWGITPLRSFQVHFMHIKWEPLSCIYGELTTTTGTRDRIRSPSDDEPDFPQMQEPLIWVNGDGLTKDASGFAHICIWLVVLSLSSCGTLDKPLSFLEPHFAKENKTCSACLTWLFWVSNATRHFINSKAPRRVSHFTNHKNVRKQEEPSWFLSSDLKCPVSPNHSKLCLRTHLLLNIVAVYYVVPSRIQQLFPKAELKTEPSIG